MSAAPRWIGIALLGAVVFLGLLFFVQTKDPMILIFTMVAAAPLGILVLLTGKRAAPTVEVRVRCPACRALSSEDAKFCVGCGQAL